jgi:hypothetical protein
VREHGRTHATNASCSLKNLVLFDFRRCVFADELEKDRHAVRAVA